MVFRLIIMGLLAACSPSDRNIRHFSQDGQVLHTISRDTEVFRNAKDHVLARAIILQRHGSVRYHLSLSVLRGGPNDPQVMSITQSDRALDYVMNDRLRMFCIDHCHKAEVGAITLSKSAFRRAANDGMVIKIHGRHRDYPTKIPARIFWDALTAANLLAPAKPR